MLKIRVDDFPGTKPDEFDRHNLENFKRFNDLMASHRLRYVLGVIPRHSTDEQLEWLASQENIEIALHGVEHDERYPNEFLPHLSQREVEDSLLRAAVVISRHERTIPKKYIPPHNVLDHRTCNALKNVGFNTVLCGPGTRPELVDYCRQIGLKCHYSHEPLEYGRSDELLVRGSVEHLRSLMEYEEVWLTLHWPWEWNIGLTNLDRYLKELLK